MIEDNKLLKAVLNRSVIQVQNCILDGEDPFYQDDNGRTYLHLSVYLRSHELVLRFIEEGLDINQVDKDELTPLHRACRTGCESIVELLLSHGANACAYAKGGITPFHIAAAFGHTQCLRALCTAKSGGICLENFEPRDEHDNSALHYAVAENQIGAVSYLIQIGSHVNVENVAGNRPLHYAATSGNPELCQMLLRAGAAKDAINLSHQTALHFATQQACVSTVMCLLAAKADPNLRDMNGNTCSHLAIKNGHIELVKILITDPRTDPSISDDDENTVLHVALKLGHFNLIPMMLPRARDLARQDKNGNSVIIEAIRNQLEDLAIQMLNFCPSLVHTATQDLVTPLHLAAERGMTDLTKKLLIAGAQVDAADSSGLTPSLYCAKNDSVLECLAMIEDIMMLNDTNCSKNEQQQQQNSRTSSKMSSRISS